METYSSITFFKTVTSKGSVYLKIIKSPEASFEEATKFFLPKDPNQVRKFSLGTIFYTTEPFSYEGNVLTCEIHAIDDSTPDDIKEEFNRVIRGDTPEAKSAEKSGNEEKITVLSKLKAKYSVPDIKDGFFVDESSWYVLLRNIKNSINTMLTGSCGTGKTSIIMLACEKMGIECNVYDMGTMHDPISGLLGVHRIQEGKSIFDYAKFTQDIQKEGVILLDELSRSPQMSANILFPCLDHRRKLQIDMAGSGDIREIAVHPKCCFMATANIGSEYTGTLSLDRALVDRFFPIEMENLTENNEVTILTVRTSVVSSYARKIASVANNIRRMYMKQSISNTVSTRETLMAAELVADGWSLIEAMQMVFNPMFEGNKEEGERSIVNKIIAGL